MIEQPAKKKDIRNRVPAKSSALVAESPVINKESTPNPWYSRPFDFHTWSDHPEANKFVDEIWDTFFRENFEEFGPGRRPKLSRKDHVKILFLDLYLAAREDSKLYLGISLTKGAYKSSRYNSSHISWVIWELVHHAHESDLIELNKGSESAGRVTRIKAAGIFITQFMDKYDIPIWAIERHYHQEVIVLNKKDFFNSKRARPIEYNDSDYSEIPKMRAELESYNELLKHTFIDIPTLENPIIEHTKLINGRPHKCPNV